MPRQLRLKLRAIDYGPSSLRGFIAQANDLRRGLRRSEIQSLRAFRNVYMHIYIYMARRAML